MATAGCGTAASQADWTRAQGGILHDDGRQRRADTALAMLGLAADGPAHVHVLNSDSIGAFGWPNGGVFVTRGLVDLLDQPELAAALAHEVGHLLDGGHMHTVVSLRGCTSDSDAEIRADAIGVRLLEQQEIGHDAMISMLEKVCASSAAPQTCRPGIRRRIEVLSAKPRTAPEMPHP